MKELYESDNDFKKYVDKYCIKHKIDRETAFEHSVIRNAFEYYKHINDGKISVTEEIKVGCGGLNKEADETLREKLEAEERGY